MSAMESYREYSGEVTAEDRSRSDKLWDEIEMLKRQWADMQSLRQAQAGVIQYLATRTEAIDEDRIQVKARRNLTEGAATACRCRKSETYRNRQKRGSLPLSKCWYPGTGYGRGTRKPNAKNDGSDEQQRANADTVHPEMK